MEDDGVCIYSCFTIRANENCTQIRDHVTMILGRKNKSLKEVVGILKLYRDNMGEGEAQTPLDKPEEATPSQRQILGGLIAFLEGL